MLSQINRMGILVVCVVTFGCASQGFGPSPEDIRQAQPKIQILEKRLMESRMRLFNGDHSFEAKDKFLKDRCSYLREEEFFNSVHVNIPCAIKTPVLLNNEKQYIEEAKSLLIKNFKDPDSSNFREVYISRRDVPVVCGEVNGKNSYGGYVGFKKFYATDTPNFFAIDDGSRKFDETWERLCQLQS